MRTAQFRLCASGRLGTQRFSPAGAGRLIASDQPIFASWRANQYDYLDDGRVDLGNGPQSVLVLRSSKGVEQWQLENADATCVGALNSGETFYLAADSMVARRYSIHLQKPLIGCAQSGCLNFSGDEAD